MDGAWRRPPKSLADYGHTEPKRGAEWWGKSPFGYFWGSFPKVTRCQSGTLSGRYRSNGYAHNPTVSPVRPPSRASPLPQFESGVSGRSHRLAGRHRRQASSHIRIAGRQASPTDIAPASLPSGTAAYYNAKSVESELEGGNPPQETWGSATPTGITHLPAHLLQARSFLRGHR